MSERLIRAVVQARMLSTRLRGKSLMSVGGTPLLMRVIQRLKKTECIDEVMVATTSDVADDPIEALMIQQGVLVYRGDRQDVLDRYRRATDDMRENDCIVRYTADNPLYDPMTTDAICDVHHDNASDYTYVDGLSHLAPEFIRVGALRIADERATKSYDREHVTPLLRKNHLGDFNTTCLPPDFSGLRPELDPYFTIDNQAQLESMEQMIQNVESAKTVVTRDAYYRWLDYERAGLADSFQAKRSLELKENLKPAFRIAGRGVGKGFSTFIVAEIGQNHNGQIGIAKRLIDMAADCGCDAVKFQKRDIGWELTQEAYDQLYDNPNSFGRTYGEHREFLELDENQHRELREYSIARGVVYFCTACDPPSVELLERVGNPVYKIASRDVTNIPLLHRVARTNKPVVLSTGMAGMQDIQEAIKALGSKPDSLLITHCVSQYPTEIKNVNLNAMQAIAEQFGHPVGLSDHTTGIITCVAAAAMGACFIEKHVTLARAMPGTDHAAALEEEGLRRMVRYIRTCELAMGDGSKSLLPAAQAAKEKLARSLTSAQPIDAGEVITESMLILKSPGTGIPWSERDRIVGRTAKMAIPPDRTLSADQFE